MQQNSKPKTRQEIANELGLSYSTFKRWLKRKGIVLPSGLVFPADQQLIYKAFAQKRALINADSL